MKQRISISLALTVTYLFISMTAFAGRSHTGPVETKSQTEYQMDQKVPAKQAPSTHDLPAKAPHGKATTPHSEELPHIHKFHKDRVKKVKRHPIKLWVLSKVLLALAHISILVISYLHAIH